MSGPGAVFGRPSSKHRTVSLSDAENVSHIAAEVTLNINGDKKLSKQSMTELKNRIVQYEIAENEACKVMRTICKDAASMFRVSWQEADIRDLLSGVLILGNLCKRIGYEKNEAESKIDEVRRLFAESEKNSKETMGQLEQVILKLQSENMRQMDMLGEANLKHGHKVNLMSKEAHSLREIIAELKMENEQLQTKMQYQERRLMEIPRLEEQYQRNARSMVRQQEQAHVVQKIEFKKVEEEVKSLNFYRNRCKMLEEVIDKQKNDIDALQSQQRMTHSKYQSLTVEFNRYKTTQQYNSERQKRSSGGGSSRPSSAPMRRDASDSPHRSASANTLFHKTNKSQLYQDENADNDNSNNNKRTFEEINIEEMMKLRNELLRKEEQIRILSKKLSHARAYPLLATQDDDDEYDFKRTNKQNGTSGGKVGIADEDQAKALLARTDIHYLTGNLSNVNYMQDELESVSSGFFAEENALQEARLLRAVDLQLEFNEKFSNHRKADPPHISAIRKSKSFVKGLNL